MKAGKLEIFVIEVSGAVGVEKLDADWASWVEAGERVVFDGQEPDSAIMTHTHVLGNEEFTYIKITPRFLGWARTVFERMQYLARPESISRFIELSKSTEQLRIRNMFKKLEIRKSIDKLNAALKRLEKKDEESQQRNVEMMIEEMSATVCE